jgi:hypothetical protein
MPALELPGRAFFLFGALFLFPARDQILFSTSLITEKKENLPFDMRRYRPAPLFIAVYGFNRYAKEFCQLLLGFVELFSCRNKFIFVHKRSSFHTPKKSHTDIRSAGMQQHCAGDKHPPPDQGPGLGPLAGASLNDGGTP